MNVYMLDTGISKAFDKVNHCCLYLKLTSRNVPNVFRDLLFSWYSRCEAVERWGNVLCTLISVTAGIRRGGVISPVLFAVHINDTIMSLKNSKLGCHIGEFLLGV